MIRTLIVCALAVAAPASLAAQGQGLLLSNTQNTGYFDVANTAGLAPANVTVEAWITYDETTLSIGGNVWPTVLRKNLAAGGEEYFLRVNAGTTANRALTWKVVTTSGAVNATWNFGPGELLNLTHVAGVWDGTTARLVVNGVTVATATGSGSVVDNGGALRVGHGDPAVPEYWNGLIDEVRIWSVARTDAEIVSTMFGTLVTGAGLEASWTLDGTVLDLTGNGHDGTLVLPANFVPVTLPQPTYQVNTAACSFDIDGVSSSIFSPGIVTRCPGTVASFNVNGSPNPWEAVITVGSAPVPDLSGVLAPWRLNIDLTDPSLVYLFGLAFDPANPLVATSFPVPTAAASLSVQLVALDATQPFGVAFSSAASLQPDASQFAASIPGPTADDTPLGPIDITAAPLNCSPLIYYGQVYTNVYVNPNGRVSFTAGSSDFSAAAATFLTDPPSVGVWSDWSPNVGGSVTIGKTCSGELVFRWEQVPYFGAGAASGSSFDIAFNPGTLEVSLRNLTGITNLGGGTNVLVGASCGNLTPGPATDPGPQDFTQGVGIIASPSDALYEIGPSSGFGATGGVLGGAGGVSPVDTINFIPNALGGYDWFSL